MRARSATERIRDRRPRLRSLARPRRNPPSKGSPSGGSYLARLPQFDKAPPARPITVAEGGGAPWISQVATDQPVAFVTIGDGWVKHPEVAELLLEAHMSGGDLHLRGGGRADDADH
jgi:hypothetical protein